MYVEQFINNGVPYIRLARSIRVKDKKGRKVARKKVILNKSSKKESNIKYRTAKQVWWWERKLFWKIETII